MKKLSFALAILLSLCACAFVGMGALAYATETYSDVLADLCLDENFDETQFPAKPDDYSLTLITIAESTDDELLLYVYQPSGSAVLASSVNLSQGVFDNSTNRYKLDYKVHTLSLVSSNGVFFKYKVDDFEMQDTRKREYEISAIYRPFDESLGDEQASGGNVITEVPFTVSKSFLLGVDEGQFVNQVTDIETIQVVSKFVGFVRYSGGGDGFNIYNGDRHFVAFDTDKKIDRLVEADVFYRRQRYRKNAGPIGDPKYEYVDPVDCYAYLNDEQKTSYASPGWFAKTYTWSTIQTPTEFIAEVENRKIYNGLLFNVEISDYEIKEAAKQELLNKKWILSFAETSVSTNVAIGGFVTETAYLVSDVSLLRLRFITDGEVYNLGVVDNRQTGSREPINVPGRIDVEFSNKGVKLFAIVLLIIMLILIGTTVYKLIKASRESAVYRDYKKRKRKR